MELNEGPGALDASLAEFNSMRQEILARSATQHTLVNLNITASATIIGLIATKAASEALLLLITLTASTLGVLWSDHARTIRTLGRHINEDIRPRAQRITGEDVLNWEQRKHDYIRDPASGFNVNWRVPMVLIFAAPALGALLLTPILNPTVGGSTLLHWILWGAGAIATLYMIRLVGFVPVTAPQVDDPAAPSTQN